MTITNEITTTSNFLYYFAVNCIYYLNWLCQLDYYTRYKCTAIGNTLWTFDSVGSIFYESSRSLLFYPRIGRMLGNRHYMVQKFRMEKVLLLCHTFIFWHYVGLWQYLCRCYDIRRIQNGYSKRSDRCFIPLLVYFVGWLCGAAYYSGHSLPQKITCILNNPRSEAL